MIQPRARGIYWAVGIAVLMHILLFIAMRPKPAAATVRSIFEPPNTGYLAQKSGGKMNGDAVRTMWSPVLFSLPSDEMGFSRELAFQDVKTPLHLDNPTEYEHFLNVNPADKNAARKLASQELMLTAGIPDSPRLPFRNSEPSVPVPAEKRVHLSSNLKQRLPETIVLPEELNRPTEKPWEVSASITVTDLGRVEHVLLKQPLESVPLNRAVLKLLYGLQFKSGEPVEGHIDIFSAGKVPENGELK